MPYASELVALIDADTRRFDQKAAGVDRTLKKLASSDPEVTVSVDDTRAQADIRGVEAALAGIEDQTVGISADASDARSEVQTVEAALAGIEDETVGISADAAQARGEVQGVSAALAAIGDETVAVTANAAQARAEVQTVEAALAGIEDQTVRVTADTGEAQAEVRSFEAALVGLEDQTIRVTAETQGATGAMSTMGSTSGFLAGRLSGAASSATALKAGIAGVIAGTTVKQFYDLGMASLNLSDTVNGTNVIFREAAGTILDFGETAANALGVSQQSALEYSNRLGTLLQGLGYSARESADMTVEAFTRANDVSSATGIERQRVIEAMIGAYAGEREAIKSIIGAITEEEVKQKALAMGLAGTTKEIGAQEKAAATHALIMEKSAMFAGDFARTQDEGLNAVARATSAVVDAAAAWGELFAPAIESVAGALKTAAEWSENVIGPIQTAKGWLDKIDIVDFGHVIGGLKTVGGWLGIVGDEAEGAGGPVRDLTAEQYNLAESLRTGRTPADEMAGGIEDVGDAADDARAPVDKFKDALDRLIGINLSAESAQIRFEEALHTVTGSLKENTHHLDSNSAEALKARGDVVSLGEAALRTAESMTTEGATVAEVNRQLATNRQRMIDHMVQGGMTRGEADKFIGSLGFTEQNLKMVAGELGLNTDKLRTMAGATQETTTKVGGLTGRLFEAAGGAIEAKRKTDELRGSVDISGSSAVIAGGKFGTYKLDINNVPGDKTTNVHTPGLGPAVEGMGKLAGLINGIGRSVVINLKSSFGFGDGPGNIRAAGSAMARARAAATGLPVRMSSGYRSPARNAAAGGSPTSYHMDAGNPASDWVGPTWALDELARRLRSAGGYRELLWRVPNHAPGDNPHVHYAHTGGIVEPSWGTLPGLRADERPVIAQVGEGILSRSDMAALATSGGSSAPVVGSTFAPVININIPANAPDAATVRQMAYDAAKAGTAEAFAEERRRNLAMNGRR